MKKRYFFIIVSLIVLIDQIVKSFVVKFLEIGEIRNFIGQAIRLNYITNTGGAFSFRR